MPGFMLLNKLFSKEEIRKSIAELYSISTIDVFICYDFSETYKKKEKVFCEFRIDPGDFPTCIMFTEYGIPYSVKNTLVLAGKLCEILNCQILIGDDHISPYRYILVKNTKEQFHVNVNFIRHGSKEETIINDVVTLPLGAISIPIQNAEDDIARLLAEILKIKKNMFSVEDQGLQEEIICGNQKHKSQYWIRRDGLYPWSSLRDLGFQWLETAKIIGEKMKLSICIFHEGFSDKDAEWYYCYSNDKLEKIIY